MAGMTKFQLILTGLFIVFILVGVMIFAFSRGSGQVQQSITIWGTVPADIFNQAFSYSNLSKSRTISVTYSQKDASTFTTQFVNALASGTGPDLVFLPHEEVIRNRGKLFPIPYNSYPERDFRDTFIEEGELFLAPEGILAIPAAVDPLVMYWNRDTFTNKNISRPPTHWDEFYTLVESLVERDQALNISKAGVALGEYRNINNAKEILSTLMFQAGTPIVERQGNNLMSAISNSYNQPVIPGLAALTFFTEFSNPAKVYYSWNRSLPNSQDMFSAGDLALYFGFASELSPLKLKNPNLNFDVTRIPQTREGSRTTTFGNLWGFAIVRNSTKISAAFEAAINLTDRTMGKVFADSLRIAPARRDLLTSRPTDPYFAVFYESALWSTAWFDPDSSQTDALFQKMVENITGGRVRTDVALSQANLELQDLIRKQQ